MNKKGDSYGNTYALYEDQELTFKSNTRWRIQAINS